MPDTPEQVLWVEQLARHVMFPESRAVSIIVSLNLAGKWSVSGIVLVPLPRSISASVCIGAQHHNLPKFRNERIWRVSE